MARQARRASVPALLLNLVASLLALVAPLNAAEPIAVERDPEQAIARTIFFQPTLRAHPAARLQAETSRAQIASELIAAHRGLLFGGEPLELAHRRTRNSLSGTQIFFRQLHRGVPVESAELIVALDRAAAPLAIRSQAQAGLSLERVRPTLDAGTAIARVDDSAARNRRVAPRAELVVLPRDGGRLVYRVELSLWSPYVDWLAYVDAHSGAVLERHDRMVHEKPVTQDFSLPPFEIPARDRSVPVLARLTGTGLVLPSNPLDGHPERYSFVDGTNVDPFRESVSLERLDGTGYLRGVYADVYNTDRPPRVFKADHLFNYSAQVTDGEFHEVNAYWHVDVFQHYIKTTLGIDGANDEAQTMFVHQGEDDNSSYSPGSDSIRFGDGGVDDSEDGEIVLHEYGHAVHDAISGIGTNNQTRALSEGFGDYCAATFSGNGLVGEWDAVSYNPGPPPFLRRTDLPLRYPQDYVDGAIHNSGRIISSAWWDLRNALGAESADQLIFESFFHFPLNGSFQNFADATLQVDLALHQGAHLVDIFQAYDGHGIPMTSLLAGDHAVPADSPTADGPFPLGLTVVSTRPLAASTPVRIHHRLNGDSTWEELAMNAAGGADWTIALPGPNMRKRIEYWFEFENDQGATAVRPFGAPGVFYSFAVGTSLSASGIEHSRQRDLPLEQWPPTLHARLSDPQSGQELLVRYAIGAGATQEAAMRAAGGDDHVFTLPDLALAAGTLIRYEIVARNAVGEAVDGPHSFKLLAPSRLLLEQNAPNPFNPSTTISFLLPAAGRARLVVYDVAGRQVRVLFDESLAAGAHQRSWDGRDDAGRRVASGVYLYRLATPSGVRAKRMTLAQ